jgi:putative AlgH/UPF0301 family transcriptional regulator
MPWWRRRQGGPGIAQTVAGTTVGRDLTMIGQVDHATFEAPGREFRLVQFSADDQSARAVEWARAQPSRLLEARYGVIDFVGRAREIEMLRSWRDEQAGSHVSVFLVHGEGGMGKTRLARHFAQASRNVSWAVWQAVHDPAASLARLPSSLSTERGHKVLLVVDYAERWPLAQLMGLMRHRLLSGSGVTVRVLLLSRSAGSWWDSLTDMLRQEYIDHTLLALSPLLMGEQSPEQLFVSARDRFAEVLQVEGCKAIGTPDLSHRDYRLVLTVHMAALAAVDARLHGENPLDDPARVSAYLLRRERHAWGSLPYSLAGRPRTSASLLGRTVYTAVLTGPLSYRDGVRLLTRLQIAGSPESAAAVLDDHQLLYPSHEFGTVLEPLYPDRLAEDFLALSTPQAGQSDSLADPWAQDAPRTLLASPDDDAPTNPWDRSAITLLIATSQRWPHIAVRHLYPVLRNRPALVLAVGGAALVSLAALPDLDPAVLQAIEPHLPSHPHVELDLGAAVLTQRLADCRLPALGELVERALLLATLGWRYGNAGMYEQAVASTQEAADLYRQLAKNDLTADVNGGLGETLGNLGFFLAELGRHDEALTCAQEAVELLRPLAEADPAVHLPELTRSLGNLGQRLSALSLHAAALARTEEAVELLRPLAEADPPTQMPRLGSGLASFAAVRAHAGLELEQALAAAEESAEIFLPLAEQAPETYARYLRGALETELGVLKSFRHQALAGNGLAAHFPLLYEDPPSTDQPVSHLDRAARVLKRGQLLVATPILTDPNYARTVLLIVEHKEEVGTLAVVLNRPTTVPVTEVLPAWGRLASAPQMVFSGGVVAQNSALGLGLSASGTIDTKTERVVRDSLVLLDLDEPGRAPGANSTRIFAGYAGWESPDLQIEIEEGIWYVVTADLPKVFNMNPYLMWEAALASLSIA